MNYGVIIPLVVSCLSGIVSILAILNFIHVRNQERDEKRKEKEEQKVWRKGVDDRLDRLTERVDSHNRYAEMFHEYGADIAYIRGVIDKLK